MYRIKIVAVSFIGARDLALSLQSVLEAAHSFAFELRAEFLKDARLAVQENSLSKAITRAQPHLLVLCLAEGERPHARAIFDLVRIIIHFAEQFLMPKPIQGGAVPVSSVFLLGFLESQRLQFRAMDTGPLLEQLAGGRFAVHSMLQSLPVPSVVVVSLSSD